MAEARALSRLLAALDGESVGIRAGHILKVGERVNRHTKEKELFDPDQIFFSPSIRYCALPQYANKVIHTCTDGEKLDVQVAFKVRLKPTTYAIGQETVRATEQGKQIDPNFSNDEIEWYTKDDERGSIVLTGFLLKCTEMRTVSEGLKHLHHPRHLRGLSRASQFSTRRSGVWALLATTKAFQSERARGHRIAGACHPAHPS